MASISLLVTFLCPFIGIFSDKINHRMPILAFSCLCLALSQFYMASLPYCDQCLHVILPVSIYDTSLSLFMANVWAALNELTAKENLGLSAGLVNSA